MKKWIAFIYILMGYCGSYFASLEAFSDHSQSQRVITIYHLTEADLNEIMHGHLPETIVEFPAQTILPLSCFIKGDLVHLIGEEGSFGMLEIKQTFYMKCVGEELMCSIDLDNWKPFLEFLTGRVSVFLNVQDGRPSIVLGAEGNLRL